MTSDYLDFNEPAALEKLLQLKCIKVRLYKESNRNVGFHTKGYTFHNPKETCIIVGSSNLTSRALSVNKEWNVKISSLQEPDFVSSIEKEFEQMWDFAEDLTQEWIDVYKIRYAQKENERRRTTFTPEKYPDVVTPNLIQTNALISLDNLRKEGKHKALVISATGTGKTYLSAFDVKQSGAKKVLFLVHMEEILNSARESYELLLGSKFTYGKVTGTTKEFDRDCIFSTIQSMSKDEILNHYPSDHFDYIICDEVHHLRDEGQYSKIFNHFKPRFILGMTATPERTDGYDIFSRFDNTIAYEIRLKDALKEEILCPFHYYGISEFKVGEQVIDEKTDFSYLYTDERIKHIMDAAQLYGYSGRRVKGLIFVRDKKDGIALKEKLNEKGWKTEFVCGETSHEKRKDAMKKLEQDDRETGLDYIISVNVFNEGIDIRTVNQVILLRPTESPIIFIQQLGRGLRKVDKLGEKKYLVVIDFIGNYENNYMIPIALSGGSLSKEVLRRELRLKLIPGCSSISFDRISEERIYRSINGKNTQSQMLKMLKDRYLVLKNMLGYPPSLTQLIEMDSTTPINPLDITEKYGTLNEFKSILHLDSYEFNKKQEEYLKFISRDLMKGLRPYELEIMDRVITAGEVNLEDIDHTFSEKNPLYNDVVLKSVLSVLDGNYEKVNTKEDGKEVTKILPIIENHNGKLNLSVDFAECLKDANFRSEVLDVVNCGMKICFKRSLEHEEDSLFAVNSRYTRNDVFRILNFTERQVPLNVGGYLTNEKLKVCPIFVTYKKTNFVSESTRYEDVFLDSSVMEWISKNNRFLSSKDIVNIINPEFKKYLFVQKGDDDSTGFYYLGQVNYVKDSAREITRTAGAETFNAVKMHLRLRTPVEDRLFSYITDANE